MTKQHKYYLQSSQLIEAILSQNKWAEINEVILTVNNAHIGTGVTITDYNGHLFFSKNRRDNLDEPQEIRLGDNVWIGMNSIILKGTTIGNNSVVSAGSVAKGYYPANSIISGNPAKVINTFDSSKFI